MGKVISFVLYIIKSIKNLLSMIPAVISAMTAAIDFVPPEVAVICIAALSILIIFTIIGRGS